jgi:hypothetical protein
VAENLNFVAAQKKHEIDADIHAIACYVCLLFKHVVVIYSINHVENHIP